MIIKDGNEYYPLDFGKMIKNGKIYYDRSLRKRNYFYLDFYGEGSNQNDNYAFIPLNSTGLITSDNKKFFCLAQSEDINQNNNYIFIPLNSTGLITNDNKKFFCLG